MLLGERAVHAFESDKVRALLVYLALNAERPHPRERLAWLLWPDLPDKKARHNLSHTFYALRKTLKRKESDEQMPLFLSNHFEIKVNPNTNIWLDARTFMETASGCVDHDPSPKSECDACLTALSEAAELYRGELLPGFWLPGCEDFEEWLVLQREKHHRKVMITLELLNKGLRARGELTRAIWYARRAVNLDRLFEPANRQLMQCLWIAGQRSAALRHFQEYSDLLWSEQGLEPDKATRRLAQRITADAQAVSPISRGLGNLVQPLTPFVGRREETRQVGILLRDDQCRLLTLLGPGGSGKTRLAIETASMLIADFPDGIFLIPMSGLASGAAIVSRIIDLLGVKVPETRTPEEQLQDYLIDRKLLLILDSFEQLTAHASIVVGLLEQAPAIKVLSTSRIPLNVQAEHTFSVRGLPLLRREQDKEEPYSEAAQLFISSARRVRANYKPGKANVKTINHICALVQGMPLGIILASGYLELMEPTEIAAQIEKSLDFLGQDWQDLPERQRSLRATLDYTWGLLNTRQQRQFMGLSVFRGDFSLNAAYAVAGSLAKDLLALYLRSLVQRTTHDRYVIHDILREYGAEKLAADPELETRFYERYSEFFVKRCEYWAGTLKGNQQQESLQEMDLERPNLVGATEWMAAQKKIAWLGRALECLARYCELRVRFEGGAWVCDLVTNLLQENGKSAEYMGLLLRSLTWQARFERLQGHDEEAAALRAQATSLLDGAGITDNEKAWFFLEMGDALIHTDPTAAEGWYRESHSLYGELADRWGSAQSMSGLGMIAHHHGDYIQALDQYMKCRDIFRELGDRLSEAGTLNEMSHNCLRQGDLIKGQNYMQDCRDIYEALGDHPRLALCDFNLSRVSWWTGQYDEMFKFYERALPNLMTYGFLPEAAFASAVPAYANLMRGHYEEAKINVRDDLKSIMELGFPRYIALYYVVKALLAVADDNFDDAASSAEKAIEIQMELGQVEDLASALGMLGYSELKLGHTDKAKETLYRSLRLCCQAHGVWGLVHSLPLVCQFLLHQGRVEDALEFKTIAYSFPQIANGKWFEDVMGHDVEQAAASLPTEIAEQARTRGQERDPFEAVCLLLEEFERKGS